MDFPVSYFNGFIRVTFAQSITKQKYTCFGVKCQIQAKAHRPTLLRECATFISNVGQIQKGPKIGIPPKSSNPRNCRAQPKR